MTLDSVNRMDREMFVVAVGWVFEDSPWVAERAYSRGPFASVEALHQAMIDVVGGALPEEQLALIRAHPDLGTRARMGSVSAGEQAGAGMDSLTPDEYQWLMQLNAAYRDKFGFPFIWAVKGSTKYDILRALEQSLAGDPAFEQARALIHIYRIALFRLEVLFRA